MQIAGLTASQIEAEDKKNDAEDALSDAKFPTEWKFANGKDYIRGIEAAKEKLQIAEEELKLINDSIAEYKALLDSF